MSGNSSEFNVLSNCSDLIFITAQYRIGISNGTPFIPEYRSKRRTEILVKKIKVYTGIKICYKIENPLRRIRPECFCFYRPIDITTEDVFIKNEMYNVQCTYIVKLDSLTLTVENAKKL